jgi:sulfide dehydrogenase cytochrome subunit
MPQMLRVALFVLAAAVAADAAAGDQEAGLLASGCTSCHGLTGRSRSAIPAIAGLQTDVFLAKMKAFRSREQPATVMNRIAPAYTDRELELMAGYFSGTRP